MTRNCEFCGMPVVKTCGRQTCIARAKSLNLKPYKLAVMEIAPTYMVELGLAQAITKHEVWMLGVDKHDAQRRFNEAN